MGKALETVVAYATEATTTAGTYFALTANTGQSFSIRQANGVPAAQLLAPWANFGVAGYAQVKSPRMHDTTIGTTFAVQASSGAFAGDPLQGLDYEEPAYSTDIITVQATTAASQAASTAYGLGLPVFYADLPGIAANLMSWQAIAGLVNSQSKVGDHYVSWVSCARGATAGALGVGSAINSTNDQFKANHSYALLGYLPQAQVATVCLQGVDTGNLQVGGPGCLNADVTRNWFVDLSLGQGLPLVPVVQANNKGNTFVSIADAQSTAGSVVVGLIWMDLGILNTPVAA